MNLSNLSSCKLVGLSSSLAIILGENLSLDDLGLLAAFLVSLSDNLALILAKKALEEAQEK